MIRKEEDGKVRVTKTEKPTQHGAWTGAGVGALVGILFPPAVIGAAIVGAGAGGLTGHLTKGISRGDLKELGDELDAGSAAVIVLGESKIEEQLEKAMTRANKLIEKEVEADADELEREIDAAAREDAGLRCSATPCGPGDFGEPSPPSGAIPRRRALPVVAGVLVLPRDADGRAGHDEAATALAAPDPRAPG